MSSQTIDRRELIARATIGVIEDRGLPNASLRAIARRAGCTTGVLTHYFNNKDDLIEQALLLALADLEKEWDRASEETNVVSALRSFSYSQMPIDARLGRKWSAWQAFVQKKGRYGKVARKLVYMQRESRRKLSSLLARGQQQGVIRADIAFDELVDLWNATVSGHSRLSPYQAGALSRSKVNHLIDTQLELLRDRTY
ncbi:MAG: TetR/AcrR family transcriptional regulator [Pseudomonadota bacterium]